MTKREEIYVGLGIFLFGAVTVILSLRMDIGTFRSPGTGLFPLILGLLLMFLSAAFVLQQYLKEEKKQTEKTDIITAQTAIKQILLFLGAMVLFTLFLDKLGYLLGSFLLMAGLLWVLKVRPRGKIILISLLTAVASYLLFVKWLKIPLPKGWIGF